MAGSLEFLAGLLDEDDPALVAAEDLGGAHGEAIGTFQAMGFLGREAVTHPVPSCPHCGEGVPLRLGRRLICNACHSGVDPRHLQAWPLDRDAFLRWLASGLDLKDGVRQVDERLWQLGTWAGEAGPCEFFFLRGAVSEHGQSKLDAYRDVLVLYGLSRPMPAERLRRSASLLEVLRLDGALTVVDPGRLLRARGNVRFEAHSGALWVGGVWLGEIAPGSREYHFLRCLAGQLDRFVPYADIKHEVLRQSGGGDGPEEATFCQKLKNRIKNAYVPKIDLLVVPSQKGEGYRLRGYAEL